MAIFYYYESGDLGNEAVRLGSGFSFTECADSGITAMSRVSVDDPTGTLTITGHRPFRAVETSCAWPTLFRGYFADRDVIRVDSLRTAAARRWDGNIADLNSALSFEVIRGADGKRPAETDTERLAWLLGSTFLGPVDQDDSAVFGADVDLDEADYRGQTGVEVVNDCAAESGNNWFVAWDETLHAPVLHYYDPARAFNTSSLKISNVAADLDGSTVWAPDANWKLNRDPSRVYSGVYQQYGEKYSAVYETSPTVLAAIGHKRETAAQDSEIRTAAKASRVAQKWLAESSTEYDTITVTLPNLPPAQVNLIRAGQRIQVKGTHLPGYTSYQWLRVTRRTVSQAGDTQLLYQLELELANPKQGGVKRKGNPVPPDARDGASVGFTRKGFAAQEDRNDCQGGLADTFSFGNAPPATKQIKSTSGHFTPGIFVGGGCNSPAVGYSGIQTHEQWLEVTGTPSSDAVGIKVSYVLNPAVIDGRANGGGLVYGYATAAPTTRRGDFTVLGQCSSDSDDSFVVPTSLVGTGDYIVIGPAWQCSDLGNACSDEVGDPNVTGAGNSGRVEVSSFTMVEVTVAGTGLTLWRPLVGDIDGVNKTYTLPDWNGRGVPRLRIGPVEYALGTDYTVDRDAGEATFRFAPWVGADLNGRWDV